MNHSTSHESARRPGTAGNPLRAVASYLVAGACLFWVFHGIHLEEFLRGMARIHWERVALCLLLEFLAYFCVAWEWQWLLRPAGWLPLRRAAQAVFAGRFANDVLPFQLGYFVRAFLAARWMNVDVMSVFPSLIVERLWDGIWLTAGIGLVALILPLPPAALRAADVLGAIVLAGTAATVMIVLRGGQTSAHGPAQADSGWKFFRRGRLAFRRLTDGVRAIGRSGLLPGIAGLSLLKLAIQAAAFLGLLWAYGLALPVSVGLAVFLAGYLGICIPSTPAGAGVFQFSVAGGLMLFHVHKSIAAGFALAAFVIITVPLAVAGFFALGQSGLRLRQVREEAGKLKHLA